MNRAVSVIMPFYNEQSVVEDVVLDILRVFRLSSWQFEVICVQNGSTDKTREILNFLAENNSEIRVVEIPISLGYGQGIKEGLSVATKDVVGYLDGDGQIMAQDVVRILEEMKSGGAIKAIRKVREDSLWRRFISFLYNLLFRVCFKLRWMDLNAKPKFFQKKDLKRLALSSNDWFIDAEIMIKSRFLGLKWQESELTFHKRRGGVSSVGFGSILENLSNFIRWRFGRKISKWRRKEN